jgi:hypothetical protein
MTLNDLKKFCADDDSCLVAFREPFTRGAYTYATNGQIAPHPTDPLGAAYIRRDGASGVLMPILEE